MAVCGDFGGRNDEGKPCQRSVKRGRCFLHPPSDDDPIPLQLLERASEGDPYPLDGMTQQAKALWLEYRSVVPTPEHAELYAAVLAFDGMVRAGAELVRDGATVEDRAHGKEARANAASLVYRRMAQSWSEWVERLQLVERLNADLADTGVESIANYL